MPNPSNIKIDDKLKGRLDEIKNGVEKNTGKKISYSMAIEVYSLKKIGIKKKGVGHPSLLSLSLPEIEIIIPKTPRFNKVFGDK